jgi:uncharacterized surface protein with fasciclin (FAS1) repeats
MRKRNVLVGIAAVLVLAGCSGDGDQAESASASAPVESMAPANDTTSDTIADVVAKTPQFSTLLTAVEEAGLVETLSGPGPFTVFAPTDQAFGSLPDGTLQALLRPANRDQLASILTYHVVPAEVVATDVTAGDVTTVNGAAFTVSTDDGVALTDGAGNEISVVRTDIEASNGVIHVIDGVLLPTDA